MRTFVVVIMIMPAILWGQRENIVSFRDNLVLTGVINGKSESFDFTNEAGQTLEYSTAPITSLGFGVDYKWLTFEYAHRVNSTDNDGLYGHTENFGIGFGFTMPKWYFRNFLESYDGYHLTDPDFVKIGYLDSAGHYPYRPDVYTIRYLATWNWVVNSDKYSSMASLWQLERQEKSAGSLILGTTYGISLIGADSSLIPLAQRDNFPEASRLTVSRHQAFTLNVGYHYTFVLSNSHKWFLHLGLNPGIGVFWGASYDNEADQVINSPGSAGIASEGRFIVGYNGDRWYFGFTSIGYGAFGGGGDNPISNFNSYNRLYLGYRFTLPESISKPLKKIGL